jgi:hypothetical protein
VVVLLLAIIIVVSAVLVRLGAFALELTGMDWEHAKFQALSAFSNSGFTTRESEQVMGHPVRRRVVTTLILVGNAGIVTTIGTFAASFMATDLRTNLLNAAIVLGVVAALFLLTRWQGLMNATRRVSERWMSRMFDFQPPRADELLRLGAGYELTRIELEAASPVANKALADIDLKSWRVQVLGIERGGEFHPVPSGKDKLLPGDQLIVYGAGDAVHKVFRPRTSTRLSIIGIPSPAANAAAPPAAAPNQAASGGPR